MSTTARVIGLTTATAIAIGVGVWAGRTDTPTDGYTLTEQPTPTVTVTSHTPYADGCTTDADCVAMDQALTAMGRTLDPPTPTPTVTAPKPRPTVTVTVKAKPKPRATITVGPVVTGPGWVHVTQEFGDALAEGESQPPENADTRKWEQCLVHFDTGDTYVVVCPDGYVVSS